MTATASQIIVEAEKAVFAFETRIQSGEFEGFDPDGWEAREALKKEIAGAIQRERERAAQIVATYLDHPNLAGNDLALHLIAEMVTAIRSQT